MAERDEINGPRRGIVRTPGASLYTGLAESTLEKHRVRGTGPRFIKLGARAVGYTIPDLDEWIAAQRRVTSTSEIRSPR